MNDLKSNWKKWISWFLLAVSIIIVYKILDNFGNVQNWFGTLFSTLSPFLIGIFIAYILILPCRKIENAFKKSKVKFLSKRARAFGVLTTYIIALLILIIIINFIFPILKDSIIELFGNIQGYYETAIHKFDELPEDSFFKSQIVKDLVSQIQNTDVKQLLSLNNERIMGYVQNVFGLFSSIFDVFVAIVVSVYILLQRDSIIDFLKRLSKKVFRKETYEHLDKYFGKANEMFFRFVGSQIMDAFIVGILVTIAMSIMRVKYAPLLGFMIGLFNIIPYFGAIIAVVIAAVITLITGGLAQAIIMIIVVIILQQIDANIINPKIIGNSLKISPLLVIFAVTLGGAYFGVMGMFLAVPVAAVVKLIMEDFLRA